jgi:hypothetical protein
MNTNTNPQQPIVIQDDNENKLSEKSSSDTSLESISTEPNTEISPDLTPDSVSTDLESTDYSNDFQSSSQPIESEEKGDKSQNEEVIEQETTQSDTETPEVIPKSEVVEPTETPPITVNIPVKKDIIKAESKTRKHYENIIKQANNIRRQFTKKRRTMSTWDDNKKHEWRTKISDTLIAVIRQAKNKYTLKHHHVKLKSMRNLFNHYLNSLSASNISKKNITEKKLKK